MHELSIAESILDAVRQELAKRPGARPTCVGLRIGEFSAIDIDSLTFCFECVVQGTQWHGLRLDARLCPQRRVCEDCGTEFAVVEYITACSACGSNSSKLVSGDELDFDYLEVETDGTPATQIESAERESNPRRSVA